MSDHIWNTHLSCKTFKIRKLLRPLSLYCSKIKNRFLSVLVFSKELISSKVILHVKVLTFEIDFESFKMNFPILAKVGLLLTLKTKVPIMHLAIFLFLSNIGYRMYAIYAQRICGEKRGIRDLIMKIPQKYFLVNENVCIMDFIFLIGKAAKQTRTKYENLGNLIFKVILKFEPQAHCFEGQVIYVHTLAGKPLEK